MPLKRCTPGNWPRTKPTMRANRCVSFSGTTLENHQRHLAIKQAYEQRIGAEKPIDLNTQKAFEPLLDQRQLDNAMIEFAMTMIRTNGRCRGKAMR